MFLKNKANQGHIKAYNERATKYGASKIPCENTI